MADGKAQVEQMIALCKEIGERIQGLPDVAGDSSATMAKRVSDMVNILESIQNKVFFRTKTSLNFTIPALSQAQRIQESLAVMDQNSELMTIVEELDSLENQVDVLKVKVASQDIIIT